ncbi:MAG: flagellar brake domain-containing protein [Desulfobacterales bacterium]|jgi:hypothetical protein
METVQLAEGVSIEVGAGLRVEIEGINFTFTSRFLGTLDTHDVLISLDPRMEHFEDRLQPGMAISASFLAEEAFHQFRARFERLISDPIRAIVLTKPDEVINIEQRLLPRTTCSVPARVDIRHTLDGTITDINPKGCRIEMPVVENGRIPLEVGDRIRLRLRAPGSQHGYIVEGQVRNIAHGEQMAETGVRFDNLPEILRNFIDTLARGQY